MLQYFLIEASKLRPLDILQLNARFKIDSHVREVLRIKDWTCLCTCCM